MLGGHATAVSPDTFVLVDCTLPQKFMIGLDHGSAADMLKIAKKRRVIEGDELFIHLDSQLHPDNDRVDYLVSSPTASYVSHVATLFPRMERWFLHPGLMRRGQGLIQVDWGGAPFALVNSMRARSVLPRLADRRLVISADMDLFDTISDASLGTWELNSPMTEQFRIMDTLAFFMHHCCFGMFFTSIRYTDQAIAAQRIEELFCPSEHIVRSPERLFTHDY